MEAGRLLVPVMPATALLLPAMWSHAREHVITRSLEWSRAARVVAVALIVAGLLAHLYWSKQARQDASGFQRYDGAFFFKHDYYTVAHFLAQRSRPDDTIAIGEAGLIAFVTDRPIFDLHGLMDAHLARLPGLLHEKFDVDYFYRRAAPWVVFGQCVQRPDVIECDPGYAKALLADPRFLTQYERAFTHRTFIVFRRR
jgi:hypothetical protein